MLVLSRKLGERLLVPHCELVLTVIAVEGDRVRLGISAPAEVAVYREEVWHQMDSPTLDSRAKARGTRKPARS
jgi:carbon storage regulator